MAMDTGRMVGILIMAIIAIIVAGMVWQPGVCTAGDVAIDDPSTEANEAPHGCEYAGQDYREIQPENLANNVPTLFRILVVGLAVFFSYALITKFRKGKMSMKDLASLIIIVVIAYFLYAYVLQGDMLDKLAFGAQQALIGS